MQEPNYTELFWDSVHTDIAKYAEIGMTADEIAVALDSNIISGTYVQMVLDQIFKQAA